MSLVCLAGGNGLRAAEELHPGVLCVRFFGGFYFTIVWVFFCLFSMKAVLESSLSWFCNTCAL